MSIVTFEKARAFSSHLVAFLRHHSQQQQTHSNPNQQEGEYNILRHIHDAAVLESSHYPIWESLKVADFCQHEVRQALMIHHDTYKMQRQELHNKLAPAIMLTSKAPPGQVSDHISFNAGTSPLGFTGSP
jgi:hypothetical protein